MGRKESNQTNKQMLGIEINSIPAIVAAKKVIPTLKESCMVCLELVS